MITIRLTEGLSDGGFKPWGDHRFADVPRIGENIYIVHGTAPRQLLRVMMVQHNPAPCDPPKSRAYIEKEPSIQLYVKWIDDDSD